MEPLTLFAGELGDKGDGVLEALADAVDAFGLHLRSWVSSHVECPAGRWEFEAYLGGLRDGGQFSCIALNHGSLPGVQQN